ncbi:MAG: ABC transporter substrate-binding protein [Nitrospirae bacterium]|nr:ABC transporter substrate-binding protein [Nitrospirota bacterium]
MKKAKFNIIVPCLLILCLSVFPAHAQKETKKSPAKKEAGTIKIGVIGPATGDLAEYGKKTLAGVITAVNEINAKGGILGRELEVLPYDDRNTRDGAVNAAIKLIEQHKVIGIIAAPTGWSSFAPTFAANSAKTIYISAGTRRKLGRTGSFIFRVSLPDEIAAVDTIAYCVDKLGYKNYAIITSMDNDYSLTLSAYFKKGILDKKAKMIDEAHTGEGYTDFRNVISELKKKSGGALDAIIYTGGPKEAGLIMEEARRQGLKAALIGGEDLIAPELWEAGKDAVVGTIAYNSFALGSKTKEAARFVELYKKENNELPDTRVALSYDAAMLLSEAIKTARSTDKIKVRDAMANIKGFRGATGATSFIHGGEPVKHPFIFKLEKTDNSYTFKLVEEKN